MYKGIFDTHAHYNDEQFDIDRDILLAELPSAGICRIVNCATDLKTCETSKNYSEKYDYIYYAAGVHPEECSEAPEDWESKLIPYFSDKKCVAVGEIGLDYHYDFSPRELQKDFFEKQLILAKEFNLPVIIHDREAHQDIWELLNKYRPEGIVHCFSGSVEMAKDIVKIGMHIGLGGAVTFKNAKKPVAVAKYVPLDKLVLETDCPYMSPVPMRGKRNNSSFIPYTAEFIAGIKNIDTQELIDITRNNACRLFKIENI